MGEKQVQKAPSGLGSAGKKLWRDLTTVYVFEPREVLVLEQAAKLSDTIVELEQVLARDGVVVRGAQGQDRMSAVVTELRQARIGLSKLLGDLAIPSADEKPLTAAGLRAQKAARSRWDRQRAIREANRGA